MKPILYHTSKLVNTGKKDPDDKRKTLHVREDLWQVIELRNNADPYGDWEGNATLVAEVGNTGLSYLNVSGLFIVCGEVPASPDRLEKGPDGKLELVPGTRPGPEAKCAACQILHDKQAKEKV